MSLVFLVAALVVIVVPLGVAARSEPGGAGGNPSDEVVSTPSSAAVAAVVPSAQVGAISDPAPTVTPAPTLPDTILPALSDRGLGHRVVADISYTTPVDCGAQLCQLGLDVYVPEGPGPFVTAVLTGPSGRGYLAGMAADLANRGILVYNADFRGVGAVGGGYPAAFQDVACAIRFARATASLFGGQAGPVTLMGHSLGAWIGSVVALDSIEFQGGCLADGSGRPDAFVGFAGNYQDQSGLNAGDLNTFFGGSPTDLASAYTAANPFNYATGSQIPVRLLAGTEDGSVDPVQSRSLEAFLTKQGWDATLSMVPGGGHMPIVDAAPTRQAIFSAIAAAYSANYTVDPLAVEP